MDKAWMHIEDRLQDNKYAKGIDTTYTKWIVHGEEETLLDTAFSDEEGDGANNYNDYIDDVDEMLDDIRVGSFMKNSGTPSAYADQHHQGHTSDAPINLNFEELLDDAKRPLYPTYDKFSELFFIVKLLHIKTIGGWTVKSFDMVIKLLQAAFPDALFPASYKEACRLHRGLGFTYTKIHVCPNDCALFWKENAEKDECPKCNASRWVSSTTYPQRIPQKVLRYFPLKPRLQRLFMSRKIVQAMRWHVKDRVDDPSCMRHSIDSRVWKDFDNKYGWFAADPHNVRLGLASDGFNPFNNMSKPYCIWPVLVVPYNLSPWLCMKDPYLIMSLLIPGPKAPENDINVFMRPLIDELKKLWHEGIRTYDAHKRQMFSLHPALLWTINDFLVYANLSGWSTKDKMACPTCKAETDSLWLVYSLKHCYMGHHRWLASDHSWRRKKKNAFNGKEDHHLQPEIITRMTLLDQLHEVSNVQLELGLRHNLDVMHIEKNICDNVLGTLMNIEGKSKYTANAQRDLENLGLRKDLHLQHDGNHTSMSLAAYMLNVTERRSFCAWLSEIKFLDDFASNIARCVNVKEGKIMGMKSHDCHIFMQTLLSVVIGGYLRPDVHQALSELSSFFKELCSRTLEKTTLVRL
ncbi:uncharacterized protein LOC121255266 [Juglans microcarpa x Juglans regia]|uniref:uncharacterized protein LOC121255266 n=1 Tax=Juglans microcarpa x Juglans regia TaxID=2249226 RepID=UPI001B7E8499|nr:uncharacterized protein LOC121255266 [Juglans microcarpa x Juglans regia]